MEVLAQDLPCFGGAQLAVDVTLVSALCSSGEPHRMQLKWTVLCWSEHDTSRSNLPRAGRIGRVHVTPSLVGFGATLDTHAGHAESSPSQPPWWSHPSGATLGATQAARHQDSDLLAQDPR